MKDFFVIKQAVDKNTLTQINYEIDKQFNYFLSKNNQIGGLRSGNLNATIGKYAYTLHEILLSNGVIKEIEKAYDISLTDYFLTVGCNINMPGSVNQHIHSDTDFDNRIIILNIPTVGVNEENGSTEIYPKTNHQPLSYLSFLLTYPEEAVRINTDLGDVFVRDSRLWHRGMKNSSENIRPMIAFTFEKKRSDHKPLNFQGAWNPLVLKNNSFPQEINFLNNWYSNNFFSMAYELMIIKFPIIRSIKRILYSVIKQKGRAT